MLSLFAAAAPSLTLNSAFTRRCALEVSAYWSSTRMRRARPSTTIRQSWKLERCKLERCNLER